MRKVTWDILTKGWTVGNPTGIGSHGWIDWLTQNYCRYCPNIWPKGFFRCPDCHRRLRTCPRTNKVKNKLVYKKAQIEAAAKLKTEEWKIRPMRVSCRRWN